MSKWKTADELARGYGNAECTGEFQYAWFCQDTYDMVYLTKEHYHLCRATQNNPPGENATLPDSNPVPAPAQTFANPKQAYGDKKVPLHLVPFPALVYESLAYKSGQLKYGLDNYRSGDTKVEAMTYIAGAKRHIEQWVAGEEVDPKELVHHLGAARASLGIIIAALEHGTLIDNRPPKPLDLARLMADAENVVEHLNKLYPEKK
ncbi:endolysin; inhibits RNA polymerase [Ralstonia phage RSJ2]|uniref:dATP/dGTP diphosphohydrolase N-terminal domain-containing protein n=1 Tax=Ralstonia phage RSJ2 TaxID=1481785 RepID=A0A068Q6Y7_9CAUD|nr:endolysin; inhibits RNA polymerase [Ralstonia phage RSJ2]BAP15830.1 hypothetical protein [Ralstonia phage RSJ2]